jgi:hypothetical protein
MFLVIVLGLMTGSLVLRQRARQRQSNEDQDTYHPQRRRWEQSETESKDSETDEPGQADSVDPLLADAAEQYRRKEDTHDADTPDRPS